MVKKHLIAGLCIGIIALFPLEAANVSFLVMETGQVSENQSGQYSLLWENGLLEVFFESGHIVSNSPVLRLVEKPADGFPPEAERDFISARTGGMDYFIVAVVDYTLPYVSMRLFSTQSPRLLHEQKYTVRSFRNTREELENVKTAVMGMIAHLQ